VISRNSKLVLVTGFALVIALMVALTVIALQHMNEMHRRLTSVATLHETKTHLLFSMRNLVRERSLSLYAMHFMDDVFEREEEYLNFTDMAAKFMDLRDRFIATGLNAGERQLLDQALAHIRESQPLQVELASKIIREDVGGVRDAMLRRDLPLEQKILALFDELVALERATASNDHVEAESQYRSALKLIAVFVALGIVLALLVAQYIVRRTRLIEKALSHEKEQAQVTLHSVGDAVITVDVDGNVVYLNPIAEQLTGWRTDDAKGVSLEKVYAIVDEASRTPLVHPAIQGGIDGITTGLSRSILLQSRDGAEYAIEDSAAPIRSPDGTVTGTVLVFRDVTTSRAMERQLSFQASHDALTGLKNRHWFERELGHMLAESRVNGGTHSLLYLDLDQFKIVNDTSGHVAGDELLRQVASVLKPLVREQDSVARLGGDEFGVLLHDCSLAAAERIAHKIREAIQDFTFIWRDRSFRLGASIGVVPLNAATHDLSTVLSAADSACYLAKEQGRNRVWVQHADDRELERHQGEMRWIARLSQALDENRFRLFCQHIAPTNKNTDGVGYAEMLVRMVDEEGELVLPMAFIPAAERYGLMSTIDAWVIEQTFDWLARHPDHAGVGVNLSAQSLGDEDLLNRVNDEFVRTGVDPARVCFEITETAAIANWSRVVDVVTQLRKRGCRFALDDFGSGMSSFGYLKGLPVDFIKIDGVFVRDIVNDPIDHAIVDTINRLGHVMGIKTIAEFVENDATRAQLQALGVDFVQGYGIHVPESLAHIYPGASVTPGKARRAGT